MKALFRPIIHLFRRIAQRFLGIQSGLGPIELVDHYRRAGVKIGEGTLFYAPITLGRGGKDPIHIGQDCTLTGCTILGHDASTNRALGITRSIAKKTVIEDECFIGVGAIILMGVRIGRGSIVGAGAIVTKDVPPFSVVAGNPARIISSVEALVSRRRSTISADTSIR